MLNYHHLYYFYVVATKKSFTRAAEFLRLQQPSLSAQIKTLEENMGYSLLDRKNRSVGLTKKGDIIFRYCQRIFDAGLDLENFLKQKDEEARDFLRIGVSKQIDPTYTSDIFSHVLGEREFQKLRLRVLSGEKDDLMLEMKEKRLDLVLANTSVQGLDFTNLLNVQLPVGLFISTKKWKENQKIIKQSPNIRALLLKCQMELVVPTVKLTLRHETDSFLSKLSLNLPHIFESDLLPVVARAVMEGIGVGFLPIAYMQEELDLGLVKNLNLGKPLWHQSLFLIGAPHLQKDERVKRIKQGLDKI